MTISQSVTLHSSQVKSCVTDKHNTKYNTLISEQPYTHARWSIFTFPGQNKPRPGHGTLWVNSGTIQAIPGQLASLAAVLTLWQYGNYCNFFPISVILLSLLCPTQGALSDDAIWRLTVWHLSHTSGQRVACAAGRLDGACWLIGLGRPGSRLPLRASIAGLGRGILWRSPAYNLFYLLMVILQHHGITGAHYHFTA